MSTSGDGASDLALFCFRLTLAVVFVMHAWNHVFGGGRIEGTARWFESLGMRPGRLHAWTASLTEFGAGVLIGLGLLTPLASAAAIAVMGVALVTTHLRNGFFIFRPGEGYEYVLVLAVCAATLAGLGPGRWSLDELAEPSIGGWGRLAVAVGLGVCGAAAQLVVFWRPGTAAGPGA
ncbi:DoxX family protein [Streptosporangium sp. NPDC001681]|uniref:DoxX family protein n=1 Tax=Streptosporangium sp. NPDC001681 TaxID=3154395 RepID=UPI003327D58A